MRLAFRCSLFLLLTLALLFFRSAEPMTTAQPTAAKGPFWIWTSDATLASAPDGTRYFRKTFQLGGEVKSANLEITADNAFTVWINDKHVGAGDQWQQLYKFDVAKLLKTGANVIAVEARNEGVSPAGLLVRLTCGNGRNKTTIHSDMSWRARDDVTGDEWRKAGYDDAKWQAAKALAPLGEGPWGNLDGKVVAGKARFTVPEGFRVETVVAPGTKIEGAANARFNISFVNMCFDAKARLLLSQEGGPIVLCLDPDKDGVFHRLAPYCEMVKNCHGMCWAHDALYLVGDGPKGTGLYRCRDTKNAEKIDSVELLFKFKGGMGEHGPHAVIHGPDDKLYVVIGNHSWADVNMLAPNSPLVRWPHGSEGPDQDKPSTTEDVLLPRLNDANGHAANRLAPGGTIWRLDLDGKNPALFAAGFRNAFDAAFSPNGELFTFDSDMEWDEGLPWYRAVRVCHCIPGADFLWRTGAANTPNYYADSLPPLLETGRGSPTGVEFYDHSAFPERYRGALFMCDWSIGVLWAVHLKPAGATYKGEAEKFCTGSPMPITDCAVGIEGALYFAVGGRGTQGGVYRIVHANAPRETVPASRIDQPLAPWNRTHKEKADDCVVIRTAEIPRDRRAREIYVTGIPTGKEVAKEKLFKALADSDDLVRRRACEACIRQGIEPPVKDLRPLLGDRDIFLRTAARLVLQRIDPSKWANDLIADANDAIAQEAIIALSKIDKADEYAEKIFERLKRCAPTDSTTAMLGWLRTIQLALVHTRANQAMVAAIASDCLKLFPQSDKYVTRELAILLAHFSRTNVLTLGICSKLMSALKESKDDRQQQIHYFYCLRVIKTDWKEEDKRDLLDWYENTKTWTGGASYAGFLQNILRDVSSNYTKAERAAIIEKALDMPLTAQAFLRSSPVEDLPAPPKLLELFRVVNARKNVAKASELQAGIVDALTRSTSPDVPAKLRAIADLDPSRKLPIAQALARFPEKENLPYLLQGVAMASPPTLNALLDVLKKNPGKPKPDDAGAFRMVLLASNKLKPLQKWEAVEVLRHWTNGKSFGATKKEDWKPELASWAKWYGQAFPKEPSLPDVASDRPVESKYKYAELLAYLEKDPRGSKGDAMKGKLAFTKASCIKCHKYGPEGEGIGPDLSTVSKRFKRAEILESIVDPSKVISDQYRSSLITTRDDRTFNGLAAEMNGTITILLQDGTKATIKSEDVDTRFASLVSVMPEKLLDQLTLEEIADLFAYLESPTPEKK